MAHLNNVSIPASGLAKHVTVTITVTGLPIMRLRWWIAGWLLQAAAWVAGCNLHIDLATERVARQGFEMPNFFASSTAFVSTGSFVEPPFLPAVGLKARAFFDCAIFARSI